FGVLGSANSLAILAGLAAGGLLGDMVGIVPVLSVAAIVRVLAGLMATTLLPRRARRPATDSHTWLEHP
ncbi:MAG: hypothetical protein ACRD1H_14345, partial [Vicinamibacterales bacterium]